MKSWESVWKSSLSGLLFLRGSVAAQARPSLANLRVCCLLVRLLWVCYSCTAASVTQSTATCLHTLHLSRGRCAECGPRSAARSKLERHARTDHEDCKCKWCCWLMDRLSFANHCQIILARLAPGAMLRGPAPVFVFSKQPNRCLEHRRRVRAASEKLC